MKTNFNYSRAVREITVTLDALDTAQTSLFTLPEGTRILDWIANVRAAFGGSEVLAIGKAGDSVYFTTGMSIAVVGKVSPTVLNAAGVELTAPTTITAQVSAGTGTVALTCVYSLPQQAV